MQKTGPLLTEDKNESAKSSNRTMEMKPKVEQQQQGTTMVRDRAMSDQAKREGRRGEERSISIRKGNVFQANHHGLLILRQRRLRRAFFLDSDLWIPARGCLHCELVSDCGQRMSPLVGITRVCFPPFHSSVGRTSQDA